MILHRETKGRLFDFSVDCFKFRYLIGDELSVSLTMEAIEFLLSQNVHRFSRTLYNVSQIVLIITINNLMGLKFALKFDTFCLI